MTEPTERLDSVLVPPADLATVTLLVAILRKVAHDVSNSLVSTVSLFDLAVSDFAGDDDDRLPPGLLQVRQNLAAPKAIFDSPMRTLPTRSLLRPRVLADWQAQIRDEAAKIDAVVTIAPELPAPPIDMADWVQCLDNAVVNALDARATARRCGDATPYGHIQVTSLRDAAWAGAVVEDDGQGEVDLEAIAAGKQRRSGNGHLGLGLPVAAMHLGQVGGQVRLSRGHSGGLRVELRWPIGLSPRP